MIAGNQPVDQVRLQAALLLAQRLVQQQNALQQQAPVQPAIMDALVAAMLQDTDQDRTAGGRRVFANRHETR